MSEKHHKYAFPGADPWEEVEPGMTLRDYFAAKALQGYIAYMGCEAEATGFMGGQNAKVLALNAYKFADAMLAEREKCAP